jgi:O-acetyl-ADP-ribose deacetylase (regulator of RNase III)
VSWLGGRLEALTGDITTFSADAIVNAANSSLLGGGGVDGAIHRAGGPSILAECRRIREARFPRGLPTGQAVITGGGRLPCRFVVHTVGPVWKDGRSGEEELLADAYRNSLERAADVGARTLAYPAISTGAYGFPPDKAARVVWKVLSARLRHHTLPEKIYLIFFSVTDLSAFIDNVPAPDVT